MITIKLFAILKDRAKTDQLTFDFTSGDVSDLLEWVEREYPALSEFVKPGRIMVSVNHEFVRSDFPVKDGDEIALMPPFSGGAGKKARIT